MAQSGDTEEFEGRGRTLDDATDMAWQSAKERGKQPGWYEITHISVYCENPIREYRVTVRPGG
jgi:hypothetical protein